MSSFTRAAFEETGQSREGRPVFRIMDPFHFDIGFEGSGLRVVVPAGFETDGASVPRWLTWLVPVDQMVKSAVVHDLLREDLRFSKLEGDAIFLTAMAAEGVPRWQRELAFLAVRLNHDRDRAK